MHNVNMACPQTHSTAVCWLLRWGADRPSGYHQQLWHAANIHMYQWLGDVMKALSFLSGLQLTSSGTRCNTHETQLLPVQPTLRRPGPRWLVLGRCDTTPPACQGTGWSGGAGRRGVPSPRAPTPPPVPAPLLPAAPGAPGPGHQTWRSRRARRVWREGGGGQAAGLGGGGW